ncbi:Lrp/AsnC family transcriptional regulator [Paucibacter sp. Y2R2-4]|uniref:Lrp/AsnC family transcriptional regulator n=1 Tax=Paucibacter sp. Y2R2-4 TaxID=2893553 RepID=UPI0021E3C5CD|nr:Lrp/AsnC family transcriptional regulator [Paucibacter sp. Y2R2-4]MCV2350204.1 Lrp/AsnC family transcriptional regulator [Paucibacter sp. Y2R2-4]
MDRLDRRILALLQHDARLSSEAIATEVGLSATAVQRRIKKLREDGVIEAQVAVLDPRALGFGVTAIVEVQLAEASREAVIDGFKRQMDAQPEVQQCYYVAGESDFVLIVNAVDMAGFERLTRRLFFDKGNIKKFRSTFVLETSKRGLNLPL